VLANFLSQFVWNDLVRRALVSCGGYVSGEGIPLLGSENRFRIAHKQNNRRRLQKEDAVFAKLFGRMCSALRSWVGNRPITVCECDGSNRLHVGETV
jgi:hypothetical protein